MRSQALRSAAVRIGALRLLLLAGFLLLTARAAHLTMLDPDGKRLADRQSQTHFSLPPARGLILDRDGKELAISVYAPSIYVLPPLLDGEGKALSELARCLGTSRRELAKRIGTKRGFTYVARWVGDEQARRIEALDLAGVGIEREPRRSYPAGSLAAPLLGFADIDGNGVRGVEQMMDTWLKGEPRVVAVERDARGRLLSSGTLDPRLAAGGDVLLALDSGLQAAAEAALAEAVASTGSKGGVVVSVDPATGDLLALAEAPGFDPNRFRHTPYPATRSRAFLDAIEPGSTLKTFLVAGALEAGALSGREQFDTGEGWMRVPGKTIRDHHPYGTLDVAGVLRVSSNVGAVQIAQRLGPERQFEMLERFGFGRGTGSGFPSESAGLLRSWRSWQPVDQATVAFGQGIGVTPVQLAYALAALANGGERMRPRLVLARRQSLGSWEPNASVSAGRAVSPTTAKRVLEMLETVVSAEGTGRLAALKDVRVAGKTGTAQLLDAESGRYSQTRYTAWFMGVVPADAPRLAIVVGLDEPRGPAHTGGLVAAPLFAQVAASQLGHLGIMTRPEPIPAAPAPTRLAEVREKPPARVEPLRPAVTKRPPVPRPLPIGPAKVAATPTLERSPAHPIREDSSFLRSVMVPDFQGESIDSARRLAARESLDLRVLGSGRGLVVSQSPAPGTIIVGPDRTVQLSFRSGMGEG